MADGNLQTCTPPDSTVYCNSTHWNDLQPVIEHISEICPPSEGGEATRGLPAGFRVL
jgi:hypothetical protein